MLEFKNDEEITMCSKKKLNDAKLGIRGAGARTEVLLLPEDPNDDESVIVEMRAAGRARRTVLFLAAGHRMLCALRGEPPLEGGADEGRRCRQSDNLKSVTFLINGQAQYS